MKQDSHDAAPEPENDDDAQQRRSESFGILGAWSSPREPEREDLKSAYFVLQRGALATAHTSMMAEEQSSKPGGKFEGDLLRATILFASTTLDAVVQNLLKKTGERVLGESKRARADLASYAETVLQRAGAAAPGSSAKARRTLAEVLSHGPSGTRLARTRLSDLVGGSFQSFERLMKAGAVLGVDRGFLREKEDDLKRVFNIRNAIAHRLDLKEDSDWETNERVKERVIADAVLLLSTAGEFIDAVADVLGPPPPPIEWPPVSPTESLIDLLTESSRGAEGTGQGEDVDDGGAESNDPSDAD